MPGEAAHRECDRCPREEKHASRDDHSNPQRRLDAHAAHRRSCDRALRRALASESAQVAQEPVKEQEHRPAEEKVCQRDALGKGGGELPRAAAAASARRATSRLSADVIRKRVACEGLPSPFTSAAPRSHRKLPIAAVPRLRGPTREAPARGASRTHRPRSRAPSSARARSRRARSRDRPPRCRRPRGT
jgi:hypothetical protein